MPDAETVADAFALDEPVVRVAPHGDGIINDTYRVETAGARPRQYILQRINRHVFPRPEHIMDNLRTLLDHVARVQTRASAGGPDLRFPTLIPARDGRDFVVDTNGDLWRTLSFIDNTRPAHLPIDPAEAREIGFALGRFHALVSDLDPRRLHDTLPGLHATPRYLARLQAVTASARSVVREPDVSFCLAFVAARAALVGALEAARADGHLPTRVIHGDPKRDNILFDADTGHAVSIIDLDTVQPGLVQYDIGDCLRSCCNTAGETPARPSDARFDLDLCRAVLQAYFHATGDLLTAPDYAHLYTAIRLIPFELGLRFVTDHLEGNRYFKVDSPGQNLHRALTQFQLTTSIERQETAIHRLLMETRGRGTESS